MMGAEVGATCAAGVVLCGRQYTYPENGLPDSRDSSIASEEHKRLS